MMLQQKKSPLVVIFDLCGTLLNSKEVDHDAINFTLKEFKCPPWHIMKNKKDKSLSMKENFPNFFGKNASSAYDMYINYLMQHINDIPFFSFASEHLQILKYQGIFTAVITNRDYAFIQALQHHDEFSKQIQPYIDTIVTADEAGTTKPSPCIIEFALHKLRIVPVERSRITFIGDAYADVQCALNYGCEPILLSAARTDITDDFLRQNKVINQYRTHKEIIASYSFSHVGINKESVCIIQKLDNMYER